MSILGLVIFYLGFWYIWFDISTKRFFPDRKRRENVSFLAILPLIGPILYYWIIVRRNLYSLENSHQTNCPKCGAKELRRIQKGNFMAAFLTISSGFGLFFGASEIFILKVMSMILTLGGVLLFCYSQILFQCGRCKEVYLPGGIIKK